MNKYLEKIASSKMSHVSKAIDSVVGWGDRLVGYSAGKAKNRLNALRESTTIGDGVPKSTLQAAENISNNLSRKSLHTRIKTGLSVAGAGTAGYLGIHKYQQHRDNQIMKKILQNAEQNKVS